MIRGIIGHMNIRFNRDFEVKAFEEYDIYLNGRHIGRINQYGKQWSVSITLPTKSWSAHIHPTLEVAQNFAREILEENA